MFQKDQKNKSIAQVLDIFILFSEIERHKHSDTHTHTSAVDK